MKIFKVRILTNRINQDLTDFLTFVYQYSIKRGIMFNFDIAPVSVSGYSSVQENIAAGGKGYVLKGAEILVPESRDHDITMFVFDLVEWKAPWYSPYPLRSDMPRSSCFLYKGKPFINLGFYANDIQNTKVTMLHELYGHAVAKIFGCSDVMDTYKLNNFPDAPDGNFAEQTKIFQPYLNPKTIDLSKWNLSPELNIKAVDFLTKCKTSGYDLKITEGYRSLERQAVLYAQGRNGDKRPKVTNAKPGESKHNFHKAFDIAFTGSNPYPSDDKKWKAIADIGISCGLTAGYYFKSFQDKPHFEIA